MKKLFESYEDFDAQTISSYVKGYIKHIASKKFDTVLDFLEDLNEYLEPLNIDIRDEMGYSEINWVTPNIAYASLREDGRITVEINAQRIFEDLVWDYENDWSVEKDTDFNQFLKELGQVIIHEYVHVQQYSKGYPNKPWKDTDPNEVGKYKYLSNKDELAAHGIAAVQEALDIGYSLSEILEKLSSLESAEDLVGELDCVRDYAMFFDSDDPRDIKVVRQLTKIIVNEALKRKRLGENIKKPIKEMKKTFKPLDFGPFEAAQYVAEKGLQTHSEGPTVDFDILTADGRKIGEVTFDVDSYRISGQDKSIIWRGYDLVEFIQDFDDFYKVNVSGDDHTREYGKTLGERVVSENAHVVEVDDIYASENYPKPGQPVEFKTEKEALKSNLYKRLVDRYGKERVQVIQGR